MDAKEINSNIKDGIANYEDLDDSDSDSTIIYTDFVPVHTTSTVDNVGLTYKPTSFNSFGKSKSKHDDEVEAIIKKYSNLSDNINSEFNNNPPVTTTTACVEISSDEELPDISYNKKLTNITTNVSCNIHKVIDIQSYKEGNNNKDEERENEANGDCSETVSRKKIKLDGIDKESKKLKKLHQKNQKREEAQREKTIKQAIAISKKHQKPEHCTKFITVLIDSEIANEKYGGELLNALQTIDIKYRLQSQLIPYSITWNRIIHTPHVDDTGQLSHTEETTETIEILLIMNWKQIVELVHTQSLIPHVESIKNVINDKKISLGIYGLENYFKYQKSKKKKEIQSEIGQAKKTNQYDKIYKDVPTISKSQLEFALTKLQLVCSCCYRTLETPEEVGNIVAQYTKAIAQIPYKMEKQEKHKEAGWYMTEDNKDCVRVDKSGNGLQRLWQQHLTTFPLARLEHAEALIAKYPTPLSLAKEYINCSESEGEKLLQDIPIRRAAGPLTTIRKVGPELSKKIHTFFTTMDENLVV